MKKILLAVFLLAGCSSAELPRNVSPAERDPVTVEAKFAGSELGAQTVVEVKFKTDSAVVSPKAQKDLSAAFRKTQKAGLIAELKIAAWSDNDSAALKKGSLAEADQTLAEKRIEALRKVVQLFSQAEIDDYNMAKSPDAFDRFFSSDEYRLKEALQTAGVAQENKKGGTSMAGKGLVMMVLAPEKKK